MDPCFSDAAVYVFIPQISTWVIRACQGRAAFHRMTGRTVVIGDCPWVAQSAEAFLSKLFACAYSNASVSVFSGNPADHLVHRFTHRVVRAGVVYCSCLFTRPHFSAFIRLFYFVISHHHLCRTDFLDFFLTLLSNAHQSTRGAPKQRLVFTDAGHVSQGLLYESHVCMPRFAALQSTRMK